MRGMFSQRALLLVIVFLSAHASAQSPPTTLLAKPTFDRAAFEKLDQAARLKFLRATQSWREGQLQNFSYDLTEQIINYVVATGTIEKQWSNGPYGLKRLGEKYLFSGKENVGTVGQSPRAFHARWDGLVYRNLIDRGEIDPPEGGVRARQFDGVSNVEYNELFGFRVPGVETFDGNESRAEPVNFPQWIDAFAAKKKPPEVQLDTLDGRAMIRLVGYAGYVANTFWFDIERDYAATKYERLYEYKETKHSYSIVAELKQFDGLWLPGIVKLSARLVNDPTRQERIYTITQFERGKVKESDLLVPFPPSAQIVDSVGQLAYTVQDGGEVKVKPLVIAHAAKAHTATTQETIDALAANPLADDLSAERRKPLIEALLARNEKRLHEGDPVWMKPAPEFDAGGTWINSNGLSIKDLRGKIVVLDFFSEWCAPCRNEYPSVGYFYKTKGDNIVVIGIHAAGSERSKIDALIDEFKMKYPILVDTSAGDKALGKTFAAYGVEAIPHAIVIDPSGKVIARGSISEAAAKVEELKRQLPTTRPKGSL